MQLLLEKFRKICILLAALLLLETIPLCTAYGGEETNVRNVRFEKSYNIMTIYFDLSGPSEEEYKVTLSLRRRSNGNFQYLPKNLSGDIGVVRHAGTNKRINWDISREFPEGITDNDFYFVVNAEVNSSSISPLVWVGGAVILGGAAWILLSKKSSSEPPIDAGFPRPPGRP
jgi:hypothetical protein